MDYFTQSIVAFSVFTLIYFIGKQTLISYDRSKLVIYLFYTYSTLTLLTQFLYSYLYVSSRCTSLKKASLPLLFSSLTWLIVFSLVVGVLQIFEGWKAPFSNTFGYLVVKMMGGTKDLLQFFELTDSRNAKSKEEMIRRITSNQSIIFNEIVPSNVDRFLDTMMNSKPLNEVNDQLKTIMNNIKYWVSVKDDVSLFMWYILTGVLVISINNNYLSNVDCIPHNITKDDEEEKVNDSANDENDSNTKTMKVLNPSNSN